MASCLASAGGTEIKKLASLVADVACLYGMWPRSDVVQTMSPHLPLKSFNDEKRETLRRSTDELLIAIGRHRNYIVELRRQQKIEVSPFYSLEKRPFKHPFLVFSDMLGIRDRIHQHIQGVVVRRMVDCVRNVHTCLQSAHRYKEVQVLDNIHLPVIQTMCRMGTSVIVDELIHIRDLKHPVYMKETSRLPTVTLETVVGSLRLSENLNGYRLQISGQPDASPTNLGFLPVNKDLQVKCKLGMFHGEVGFVWTRKSRYNRTKTSGFFYPATI
ncbi:uncharacterized protein [Argopecten irradians]|uniref:uncharacterized protein n=1 Tax=Argopecten irradians TaxID=31199 RepID=UPI0037181ADE